LFTRIAFPATLSDWGGKTFEWKGRLRSAAFFISRIFIIAAFVLTVAALADPEDPTTTADSRKADYRESLRLGNDAAIDKLRALGEPADDINRLLDERKNTTAP